MVVLIPVTLRMQPVLVLIPPAMLLAPATLSHLVQFSPLVLRLPAIASVVLNGLVKLMFGMGNSTPAAVDVFRV